jgi:hypothetical protein
VALPSLLDLANYWKDWTKMTKLKLKFAEGCFDNFDGTQEELQALIADLHQQLEAGTLFENAVPVTDEEERIYLDKLENKILRQ